MKKISKIILIVFRAISIILSPKLRTLFGRMIGSTIFQCWKSRRNIAIDNLAYSFPEKSKSDIKIIAKKSFQSLTITFLEFFVLDSFSKDKLKNMIDFDEGLNVINNARSKEKGMLFLSGHFGNWELIAYSVGIFTGFPITIIVKPQANQIIDNRLNKIRTFRGNKIVSMYNAARTIIKEIRCGGTIALLADQAATEDTDVFVNFLGRPASTFKVVAELALRYRIPLIIGFAVRQSNGKYKAELSEIDYSDLIFSQKSVLELTERHVKYLENIIRQYPEQWAWMHKRWKHHPK